MFRKLCARGLCLSILVVTGNAFALSCAATQGAAVRQWLRQQMATSRQGPALEGLVPRDGIRHGTGYGVQRTMVDPVTGRQWALVGDCAHPERPLTAVLMAATVPIMRTQASPSGLRANQPALLPVAVASPEAPGPFPAHVVPPQLMATGNGTGGAKATAPVAVAASLKAPSNPTPGPVLVRAGDPVVVWGQGPQIRLEIAAVALDYGHAGQLVHLRRKGFAPGQNITMTGVVRGPGSVELLP